MRQSIARRLSQMTRVTDPRTDSRLVYSTESGRTCPECRQPVKACQCRSRVTFTPSDGVVRVTLDTKGRKGKGVTVVKGLALESAALTQLGKQLRSACGAGGTTKDGVIEVQGDHCERLIETLRKQGYDARRAGG